MRMGSKRPKGGAYGAFFPSYGLSDLDQTTYARGRKMSLNYALGLLMYSCRFCS